MKLQTFPVFPSRIRIIAQYILVAFGVVASIVSFAGDLADGEEKLDLFISKSLEVNAILHLVLVFLVLLPGRIDPFLGISGENFSKEMEHLRKRFLSNWTGVWVCWGLYYITFYQGLLVPNDISIVLSYDYILMNDLYERITGLIRTILNLANTYFLFFCYLSIKPEYQINSESTKHKTKWKNFKFYWVVILLVFVILEFYGKFINDFDRINSFSNTLMSLVGAIVLGLLAGRLDSKYFIGDPRIVIFIFLYGAIQVFSNAYEGNDDYEKAAFAFSAFTLKCVFYIHISRVFEDKSILYYLSELKNIEYSVHQKL